jgi:hypothetical protein
MTPRKLMCVAVLTLFVAVPTALASSKWYVDGVHGKNKNDCKSPQTACKTIGHAIALAHSGDTVKVAPATYTENLTIGKDLKIIGTSATTTVIDGGAKGTVIIIAQPTAHVTLSAVTIQNGANGFGAGIFNNGTLTVKNSTISGNHAVSGRASGGGGIYNSGKASINNSTISGNSASAGSISQRLVAVGGGIYNSGGKVTINNSTISGNSASAFGYGGEAQGGGIDNDFGTLTINNSTVTGNNASSYYSYGSGGGIAGSTVTINNSTVSGNGASSHYGKAYGGGISASATLQNSIVANNPSGGNCGGNMTSKGYNLSSDGTCNFNGPGDLNNTDPLLGQLGNYGGPTQTIPLLSGSPAIDAGNPSGCSDGQGHLLKTDQRGKPRPDKEDIGGCDMGAFERQKD